MNETTGSTPELTPMEKYNKLLETFKKQTEGVGQFTSNANHKLEEANKISADVGNQNEKDKIIELISKIKEDLKQGKEIEDDDLNKLKILKPIDHESIIENLKRSVEEENLKEEKKEQQIKEEEKKN